jgi:hypothetical protein
MKSHTQYQSINKYWLVLIDIDTYRLSILSIKFAGYKYFNLWLATALDDNYLGK